MMQIFQCSLPPVDHDEILRYMKAPKSQDERIRSLVLSCLDECERAMAFEARAVYEILPQSTLKVMLSGSKTLDKATKGCEHILFFAATLGHGLDRLILRYSRVEPLRALCLQAIGAERIEAFCDALCSEVGKGYLLTPRVSPGYGDLPLSVQKIFFESFNISRLCGITLSEGLLMSPSKSVTALAGARKKSLI